MIFILARLALRGQLGEGSGAASAGACAGTSAGACAGASSMASCASSSAGPWNREGFDRGDRPGEGEDI